VSSNLTHTTLCNKVCQLLATDRWLSPGTPFSSTNIIDCHDINKIMLKVVLNTITITLTLLSVCSLTLSRKKNGVLGESQRSVARNWQTLLHSVVWVRFELTTLLVIGTDCTYSYKSNFHKMMTKESPLLYLYYYSKTNFIQW
jgi:hypothetical protein